MRILRRAGAAGRGRGAQPRDLSVSSVVDVIVLIVLLGVGVMAYGPVFGGLPGYRAAGGGVQLGMLVALLSSWRGWSLWLTASVASTVFLLFGGLFALPGEATAGVAPGPDTARRLLSLSLSVWGELPTLSTPAPEESGATVLPYLAGMLCALAAGTLALRGRRPLWALVPVLLFVMSAILWGTEENRWAVPQGLMLGVGGLAWASWRSARTRALAPAAGAGWASRRRGALAGLAVLGLATGVAGAGAAGLSTVTDRDVLRESAVPQLDLGSYPSPLLRYRDLAQGKRYETLLSVRGLPRTGRLRVATLESYDGVVYDDGGGAGYVEIDEEVEPPEGTDGGNTTTVQVTVEGYDGVWLPGGGDLRRLVFDGPRAGLLAESAHYDPATGNVLTTAGLEEGDGYRVNVVLPRSAVSLEDLAGIDPGGDRLPPVLRVPSIVLEKAVEFAADETDPALRLASIAETLSFWGYFSDGSDGRSPAGHSAPRMHALLTGSEIVGDDEQYAVLTALMARKLGIPARVVLGFHRETRPEGPGGGRAEEVELTGADLHVWAEASFEGHGWVPIEATPPREKTLPVEVSDGKGKGRKGQRQDRDDQAEDADDAAPEGSTPAWWLLALVVLLLAVTVPPLLVVLLKGRRRRRRRTRGTPVERAVGGWAEVVDAAADLGSRSPDAATRREGALVLAAAHPDAVLLPLADEVDAWAFGPGQPTPDDLSLVWAASQQARATMARDVSRRRRWWAKISPASLRSRRG
ncbi:transglutaminase family protein [Nocardioides pacificus]